MDITQAIQANGFLIGMLEGTIAQLPDKAFPPERKQDMLAKAQKAHNTVHDALAGILMEQYEQE